MEGGGFAATFYCLIGNFVEIVLVSKNAREDRTAAEHVASDILYSKKIMQGTGTQIAGERGIYDRDYEKRK